MCRSLGKPVCTLCLSIHPTPGIPVIGKTQTGGRPAESCHSACLTLLFCHPGQRGYNKRKQSIYWKDAVSWNELGDTSNAGGVPLEAFTNLLYVRASPDFVPAGVPRVGVN